MTLAHQWQTHADRVLPITEQKRRKGAGVH